MALIHYLWVGPPTKTNPNAIAGHDVAGPIAMARNLKAQNSNDTVKFWCLEEYKTFYESQFTKAGVDNIQVCSIEAHVAEEKNKRKEAKILETLINTKAKSDITNDRVAFKDVFSLFLLATQGGFFFDTNVFPSDGKRIDLNKVVTDEVWVAAQTDGLEEENLTLYPDFFIMHSPAPNNHQMQAILENWLNGVHDTGMLEIFRIYSYVFLMEPPELEKYKISDLDHLYLYKEQDNIFYYIKADDENDEKERNKVKKVPLEDKDNQLPPNVKKNLKFNQSADHPEKLQHIYGPDEDPLLDIIDIALKRKHIHGSKLTTVSPIHFVFVIIVHQKNQIQFLWGALKIREYHVYYSLM